ncbi:MAG: exodeoxyribonuclease VII small subunit [Campylobacterales bacterium]
MDNEVSFEAKLEQVKGILAKLMNPEVTLAESVTLYQEGMKQIKEAQKMVEEAQLQVAQIEAALAGAGE